MSLTRILRKADPAGLAWRLQGDGRLVVGRASAGIDDDPAVGQCDNGRLSGEDHPAAEYFGVEAPGALDIVRDDEVGQHDSLGGRRELGHLEPPLVGSDTPHATRLRPMLLCVSVRLLGTMPMTSLKTAADAGSWPARSPREDDPTPACMPGIRGRAVDLVARLAEEPARLVEPDSMWQNRTFGVRRTVHRHGCW